MGNAMKVFVFNIDSLSAKEREEIIQNIFVLGRHLVINGKNYIVCCFDSYSENYQSICNFARQKNIEIRYITMNEYALLVALENNDMKFTRNNFTDWGSE